MGGDGDPLDALVLVGEPTFPAAGSAAAIVGVFHMADEKGPDEKILCVPLRDPAWMRISDVHDIPAELRNEIEHFFQVYKDLEEAKVETRGYGNRVDAERVVAEARARARPADVEGADASASNRPSMAARRKKRPLRPRVPSRVKKRTKRSRSHHENELLGLGAPRARARPRGDPLPRARRRRGRLVARRGADRASSATPPTCSRSRSSPSAAFCSLAATFSTYGRSDSAWV